jgi:hypothetical protein
LRLATELAAPKPPMTVVDGLAGAPRHCKECRLLPMPNLRAHAALLAADFATTGSTAATHWQFSFDRLLLRTMNLRSSPAADKPEWLI